MTVGPEYKRRTMRELEADALRVLSEWGRPIRCGLIGDQLFRDCGGGLSGSAPYARTAGRIMRRLEKRGLAYDGRGGWALTFAGQSAAKSLPNG